MTRAALLLPGRGSYAEASLGQLPPGGPWLEEAERQRAEAGLEPLLDLDRAARFEPSRHLKAANAAPLIYLRSMLDAQVARERHDVVCVGGNSLGWYTALAAAGSLDFADGFRLVQRMAQLQEEGPPGGQLILPVVDEDWRPDPDLGAAVDAALAGAPGEAFPSIRLGGYRVLAGSPAGLAHLTRELPRVTRGETTYPFRLALHGPYHTPLARSVAEAAAAELTDLRFRRPELTLIDGFGRRHSPWSADVDELEAYTLGAQVTEPFDFTATARVALREWAPDRLVLTGPGNTLGGIVGQVLCEEGWSGIRTRADFAARQAGDAPLVDSMGR